VKFKFNSKIMVESSHYFLDELKAVQIEEDTDSMTSLFRYNKYSSLIT